MGIVVTSLLGPATPIKLVCERTTKAPSAHGSRFYLAPKVFFQSQGRLPNQRRPGLFDADLLGNLGFSPLHVIVSRNPPLKSMMPLNV